MAGVPVSSVSLRADSWIRSPLISTRATFTPARDRLRALAKPMPRAPPVISATRSFANGSIFFLPPRAVLLRFFDGPSVARSSNPSRPSKPTPGFADFARRTQFHFVGYSGPRGVVNRRLLNWPRSLAKIGNLVPYPVGCGRQRQAQGTKKSLREQCCESLQCASRRKIRPRLRNYVESAASPQCYQHRIDGRIGRRHVCTGQRRRRARSHHHRRRRIFRRRGRSKRSAASQDRRTRRGLFRPLAPRLRRARDARRSR